MLGRVGLLVLVTAACHHRTVQYVHFDANKNAVVLGPSLIRTGDSLYFVSYDTLLAAKYQVGLAQSDAVVGAVAPLYGGVDISKLAAGIPETIRAVARGQIPSDPVVGNEVMTFVQQWPIEKDPGPTLNDLRRLVDERAHFISQLCERSIRTATTWVLYDPARVAYFRGIFDSHVRDLTTGIVGTSLADTVPLASLLQRASDRLMDGRSDTSLADSLRVAGTRWSRRLAALLIAFGGPDALAVGQSDDLATQLGGLAVCRREDAREAHPNLKQLNDSINKLWNTFKTPPPFAKWPQARSVTIAGFCFDVLIDEAHKERPDLDAHIQRLNTIAGLSTRLETALAAIPEFTARTTGSLCGESDCNGRKKSLEKVLTRTSDTQFAVPDTVLVGVYWKATRLVLTPQRGQRYPNVVFSASRSAEQEEHRGGGVAAGDEGAGNGGGRGTGPKATSAGGKDKSAPAPGEGQPAGPSPSSGGDQSDKSKESGPPKSPYPAITIDVLEPSRFQLGVGFGRARLGGDEYSQEKDTVDGVAGTRVTRTGERPYVNLPLLTLSYYVLPLRGKVFAGQAYDGGFLANAGLAVTLGLALDAPFDRVFLGLSTEPAPGVNISLGVATAYIEKADTLGFVPADVNASPVRKAWKRGAIPAWAVSIDPGIALSALGKLIGLK